MIKSIIFDHCLKTLKLEILKLFPQLGLFTRYSAMDDFFIAFLTGALILSFQKKRVLLSKNLNATAKVATLSKLPDI